MPSDKPNYIFFVSDQHRADHPLGFYGNSGVQTPNIDRMARSGTRFEQFYVANPFCMPNRASMMTGRMPSCIGHVPTETLYHWNLEPLLNCS
ncbi:MAG: hypothetical protein CM1200mP18_04400 [Gammaproteobacteria bacterium]|nr:MAG: hypothetical protein CM1200mP18_04400 [Gammaproteobacteria bacterium]